jgi:hypothetical protein
MRSDDRPEPRRPGGYACSDADAYTDAHARADADP